VNPNPDAATVLCYGDSNTNGQRTEEVRKGRLPAGTRWTGRLQRLLGERYAVIEEGLGGRTTSLDDPARPGRNGRAYFGPCIQSHEPLDYVVIMLGTTDLKPRYGRDPAAVADALNGYFDDLATLLRLDTWPAPTVILLSPVHIDDTGTLFAQLNSHLYDATSVRKSRQLAGELRELAMARGAVFRDAAAVAHAGADGVHLSLDSHQALAALLAGAILAPARMEAR
jgi:lysophospholipase L1-like esterase